MIQIMNERSRPERPNPIRVARSPLPSIARPPARRIRAGLALAAVFISLLALRAPRAQTDGEPPKAAPPGSTSLDSAGPALGVPTVLVVPVEGEIENGLQLIISRALRQSKKYDTRAIVLDMDTPGGRIDSAVKIRDQLVMTKVPTYTYVNHRAISAGSFIALATDTIVMSPSSNIGAALPIIIQGGEVGPVGEKMLSYMASEMRKTAKFKDHPADIAEAFSNPDIEIPGLIEKGKILTLDHEEATSVGLAAYISPSLEDLLEREGLGSFQVVRFELTWTDAVARFLATPVVTGLLMTLGLGGLFFEVKSPGFGVPGAVGLLSLGLYFFGAYLANLSGYMELIFFVAGVVLLIVEVFVIPGFGIFGGAGITFILGSLFFALFNRAPEGFDFDLVRISTPVYTMFGSLIAMIPLVWLVSFILPHTPFYSVLRLEPPAPSAGSSGSSTSASISNQSGASAGDADSPAARPEKIAPRLGDRGTALTTLRPAGTGRFEGRRVDVMTEGDFIDQGSEIEIILVEGNRIVVRKIEAEQD